MTVTIPILNLQLQFQVALATAPKADPGEYARQLWQQPENVALQNCYRLLYGASAPESR